jgi:hypothetical protein
VRGAKSAHSISLRPRPTVSSVVSGDLQDCCALDLAGAESVRGLVRILERKRLRLRPDGHLRRQRQELLAVAARQVRHRAEDALAVEKLVGERRDVAHVDPGADDGARLAHGPQRGRHELADRREQDRGVELLRRPLVRAARPQSPERAGELLALRVAGTGEREDAPPLVLGDLATMCAEAPITARSTPTSAASSAPTPTSSRTHVCAGIKSHPGVAAKTFATLEAAGIDAPIVSTLPIKIACHVPSADVDRAVQALHEAFDLA